MSLKCVIIDDEPLAKDVITSYIDKTPELELIGYCESASKGIQMIHQEKPDLIFLDIQMPEMDGIQMLKSLAHQPYCIFTTAHSEFAVDAFDLNARDYLLKPISFDRFLKAVNKVFSTISSNNMEMDTNYTFVKSDKKLIKVYYDKVLYIEGLKDYVMIYTEDEKIITLQTMKNMEENLPADKFMRVHRSYIINSNKIQSIAGNTLKVNEREIPIGKNYKNQIMDMVDKNNLIK